MSRRLTKEEFLAKLTAEQLEMYDFSEFEYVSTTVKSKAICRKHGEFWIRPGNLISGQGCMVCGYETVSRKVSAAKKIDVNGWEAKKCRSCGVEKLLSEFDIQKKGLCGRRSECRVCYRAKMRKKGLVGKKLKMFVTHKKCNTCGKCLPAESFRELKKRGKATLFHQCLDREKRVGKEVREKKKKYFDHYREMNRNKLRDNSREYYKNNSEAVLSKAKEDNRKKASFLAFGNKLPSVDGVREGENGLLLVRCKHCRKLFTPTKAQCRTRMAAVKGISRGENNLYCSEKRNLLDTKFYFGWVLVVLLWLLLV